MREYSSCKEAIDSCLSQRRFAVARLYSEEKPMQMHIHDCYEIYFSISGGKQFFINDRSYDITAGDIFAVNQYETHYLVRQDGVPHERYVVSIHPSFLDSLSTGSTNLAYCFQNREKEFSHRASLDKDAQKRFIYLLHKITSAAGFGADLIENAAFMEWMVLINGYYLIHPQEETLTYRCNEVVSSILDYVNRNITEELSISSIAGHFYLSDAYICRLFKSETGTTINKYLTARRISIAKSLLASGATVNEACEKSGFGDYTSFVKAFHKAVGISPKSYGKCSSA